LITLNTVKGEIKASTLYKRGRKRKKNGDWMDTYLPFNQSAYTYARTYQAARYKKLHPSIDIKSKSASQRYQPFISPKRK